MRTLPFVALIIVIGSALVVTTGGCGGGGAVVPGGETVIAGPSDADFVGGYFWQLWTGSPAANNASQWGIVTADGAGSINAGLIEQNAVGALAGPFGIGPLPYTVDASGRLEIDMGGSTLAGGITEDGAIAAVTQITPGNNPTVAILPRGQGVYNDASLNGEYHLCSFWWNGGGELARWGGTVTFDGVGGGFNYSAGLNNNGFITPPGPPMGWGAYSVGPAGRVTWNHPIAWVSGGIGLGGDLIVFSGSTQATDLQILTILIRKGAGLNNATLSGSYNLVLLGAGNAPPPRYTTSMGTVEADGAGQMVVGPTTSNTDGAIAENAGGAMIPYAVGPDGTLTASGNLLGGVSPDGRCAVFSGGNTGGSSPQIWFLYR